MGTQTPHHEVFHKFVRWNGRVPEGCHVDFLGVVTRMAFIAGFAISETPKGFFDAPFPEFNEEYFEWISLLDAVTTSRGRFVMMELGAGYGRWLVRGALAARSLNINSIPCDLVGVEAEPTHFRWMRQHFEDNGLDPGQHQLINAAVADRDGKVRFLVGIPERSYGQRIAKPTDPSPRIVPFLRFVTMLRNWFRVRPAHDASEPVWPYRERRVRAISLNTLLRPLERIDLIDIDVQDEELVVLRPAMEQLDAKVRSVFVATHDHEIEAGIRLVFDELRWEKMYDYPCASECDTRWGLVKFQDGVQRWINPRLW